METIQIYASRNEVAYKLWVDPRTIKKMILDRKILVAMFKWKKRYIITKDIFINLC